MVDSNDIASAQQCDTTVLPDFPNEFFNPEFIDNNSDNFSTAASFVGISHNFTFSLDIFPSLCNGIALKYCYKTNIENETELFEISLMSLADETINVSTVLRARDQVDNCFDEFCCDEMPLSNISFSFYDTLNVTVCITVLSGSLLQLNKSAEEDWDLQYNMTLDDFELSNMTLTLDLFGVPLLVGLIIGNHTVPCISLLKLIFSPGVRI